MFDVFEDWHLFYTFGSHIVMAAVSASLRNCCVSRHLVSLSLRLRHFGTLTVTFRLSDVGWPSVVV